MKDLQCKAKLHNCFTGPYIIIGKSSTGSYFLCDRHSHTLKCPIPQQQLVEDFEAFKESSCDSDDDVTNNNHTENTYTPSKNITIDNNETDSAHSPCGSESESLSENDFSCKRLDLFFPQDGPVRHSTPIHTPIQSQMVIISSKDGACSVTSEESSLIDVGVDNPMGNMDVNDIPMEIVSNPIASDIELIIGTEKCIKKFEPLSDSNRKRIAMKFNFCVSSIDKVEYTGNGNHCTCPPVITQKATGNRACLFNSFSILLSGKELYNTFIKHAVCNYICDPRNWDKIKQFIPDYKSGKHYVDTVAMHRNVTWGTEVKIICVAQMSCVDVVVYTQHSNWARYCADVSNPSNEAFYLSNASGSHFDPVLDV